MCGYDKSVIYENYFSKIWRKSNNKTIYNYFKMLINFLLSHLLSFMSNVLCMTTTIHSIYWQRSHISNLYMPTYQSIKSTNFDYRILNILYGSVMVKFSFNVDHWSELKYVQYLKSLLDFKRCWRTHRPPTFARIETHSNSYIFLYAFNATLKKRIVSLVAFTIHSKSTDAL